MTRIKKPRTLVQVHCKNFNFNIQSIILIATNELFALILFFPYIFPTHLNNNPKNISFITNDNITSLSLSSFAVHDTAKGLIS